MQDNYLVLTQQVQDAQADLQVQVAQPQAATSSPILRGVKGVCGEVYLGIV